MEEEIPVYGVQMLVSVCTKFSKLRMFNGWLTEAGVRFLTLFK